MFSPMEPPIAEDRRNELTSEDPPNYGAKSDAELKAEMRRRGLELHGRRKKVHYVRALLESDQRDLDSYKRWDTRNVMEEELAEGRELPIPKDISSYDSKIVLLAVLKQRQDGLFASKYKYDASRITFLDLPAEIRNMIYNFALFCPYPCTFEKIFLLVGKRQFSPFHRVFRRRQYPEERIIATLALLGAINVEICRESRAYFWVHLQLSLTTDNAPQHEALHTFLSILGLEASASILHSNYSSAGLIQVQWDVHGSKSSFLHLKCVRVSVDSTWGCLSPISSATTLKL